MSDTPKFEVIDRRRQKAAEEQEQQAATPAETPAPEPSNEPAPGPRLVVTEGGRGAGHEPEAADEAAEEAAEEQGGPQMPPPPTAEEIAEQKAAYDATAQRLDELIRAQNPALGATPAIGFEHLVQQFYLSAMINMGAGTPEGQRPRFDPMAARGAIDLLGVILDKTSGNLSEDEERMLQTVLFDLRMAFLEVTRAISMQAMQAPPVPPPVKN
jgi:hypothetical protein